MKLLIKTKQFTLRSARMSDADDIAKYTNNRIISRNMARIPYPYKKSDAINYIKRTINSRRRKQQKDIMFVIEINNEVVGGGGLHKIIVGHKASLGYWLGKKYWNLGIMTDVVKAVSVFAFRELKLKRLEAEVFTFNPASKRVLEKNGFREEGVARKYFKKGNRFIDCFVMAKTK